MMPSICAATQEVVVPATDSGRSQNTSGLESYKSMKVRCSSPAWLPCLCPPMIAGPCVARADLRWIPGAPARHCHATRPAGRDRSLGSSAAAAYRGFPQEDHGVCASAICLCACLLQCLSRFQECLAVWTGRSLTIPAGHAAIRDAVHGLAALLGCR